MFLKRDKVFQSHALAQKTRKLDRASIRKQNLKIEMERQILGCSSDEILSAFQPKPRRIAKSMG